MERVVLTLDLPPFQDGGLGTLALATAQALAERGPVALWTRRGPAGTVPGLEAAPHPIALRRWPGHSWRRLRDVHLQRAAWRLRRERSWLWASAWEVARVPSWWGVPSCVWAAGLDVLGPHGAHARRATLGRARAVLALTEWLAQRLAGQGVSARVLAPAVPWPAPIPVHERARWERALPAGPRLLCLGRLVRRKGQDTAIRSVSWLARHGVGVQLLIAGQGPDRARLEQLVAELGVGDRVHFLGFIAEARRAALYASCQLHLLCAREEPGGDVEGFGLTLVEAALAGTPSVGSDSGGVGEALAGVAGQVAPLDPAALGAELKRLLAAPEELARRGERARAAAAFYLPAALGQRIAELEGELGAPPR